ncbi:hypothetical protein Trydic_g17092 [Trypoxylus dichotomus]
MGISMINSVCLHTGKGNFLALRIQDEIQHVSEYHKNCSLIFTCTGCHKQYKSKHAAECHLPKCTGQKPQEDGEFRCDLCNAAFATKRGLSQHQRLKHPLARNEARAAETATTSRATRRGKLLFSPEDLEQLFQLEVEFRGERFINKLIAERLPDKTAKQIGDKRREAAYCRFRDEKLAQLVPLPEEDPPVDPEASGEQEESLEIPPQPSSAVEIPAIEILNATQDSASPETSTWREGIIEAVLAHQLPKKAIPAEQAALIQLLKSALLYARDCDGQVPQAHIDHIYGTLESHLASKGGAQRGESRKRRSPTEGPRHRPRRQYIYARTQDLYKKNPGLVAKYVREKIDWWEDGHRLPPPAEISELYTSLWGTKPAVQTPVFDDQEDGIELLDVLQTISLSDVRRRISNTKPSAAAGPDGIQRKHLSHWVTHVALQYFFNFIMCCGRQPTHWRVKNRTTLVRKDGKDGSSVQDYRPITISSLLSRLYWGLIDQRLRRVVRYSPRQKGFIAESGCYNNVHIFNELLRHSKSNNGLVVVQLDLSKAFDTIPHVAIGPALRRKGLPETVVRLVEDQYKDVHMNIQSDDEDIKIFLQRGVKQGDPLSPFIFNAVIEPLLLQLEKMPGYSINGGTSVSSLAFADDLILTANNVPQARELLEYTEAYLSGLGMTISAPKCACFRIAPTKDSWYLADPGIKLSCGAAIPYADAETKLNYLGMQISPWAGISSDNIKTELLATLQRVKKLALKPYQKVNLISTYLVPHYLYQLVMAVPPMTLLRCLDQELRVVIKDIYHLPQSTANGLIYCGKRDGGLGFPKLEVITVTSTLAAGYRYLNSTDPVMQALAEDTGMVARLKRLANSVRVNWPLQSLKDIQSYKRRARKTELAGWSELNAQGKSVQSLTDDPIGNAWLYKPQLLQPCRFITALKMRTKTTANRVVLARAGPVADPNCRKCRTQKETLGHILGQCVYTKPDRIRRHDEIRDFIVAQIHKRDKRVAVTKEPVVRLPLGGNLKPDLVIENQGRISVVDVTVRHEDNDYLAQGRLDKLQKYSRLLPILQRDFGASSGEVLPVVVGTRGAMPKETVKALSELGLKDRNTLLTISLIALRSSIELYHKFMDYDGPNLRRNRELVRPD